MTFSEQEVSAIIQDVTPLIGAELKWRWEDRLNVMLSELARDKKDKTLNALRDQFEHEWDRKSIKSAPLSLKSQLGELAKVTKEQLIFSIPAVQDKPALVAFWWPWGHGGTFSIRLLVLSETYQLDPLKTGMFDKIKAWF